MNQLKRAVAQPYHEILLRNKKERATDNTQQHMALKILHYAEWEEPISKGHNAVRFHLDDNLGMMK